MKHNGGFSLVELAVVMAIVGLLIGGVLGARVIIRNAELNSVNAEIETLVGGFSQFVDIYSAVPGDMTNATDQWGTNATCPGASSTKATCNGDGNGLVALDSEVFLAMQHLANAGMLEGSYTGAAGSLGAQAAVVGTNVPRSRLSPGGLALQYLGTVAATHSDYFEGSYNHAVFFGAGGGNTFTRNPILTPADAFKLDNKFDDGLPGKGKTVTTEDGSGTWPNCATTSAVATAAYDMSQTGPTCILMFKTSL